MGPAKEQEDQGEEGEGEVYLSIHLLRFISLQFASPLIFPFIRFDA